MGEHLKEILAILPFVGTCFAAIFAWRVATGQARRKLTFELHREFNGMEMSKNRDRAEELVKKHRHKTIATLRKEKEIEETMPLVEVARFYHRLAASTKHQQVDDDLVIELFGRLFVWWYEVCFAQMLIPTGWETANHLQWFYGWLRAKSTHEQWEAWHAVSTRYVADLVAKPSTTHNEAHARKPYKGICARQTCKTCGAPTPPPVNRPLHPGHAIRTRTSLSYRERY